MNDDHVVGEVVFCGTVCIDIHLVSSDFPVEDSKSRLQDVAKHVGGNAANSAVIYRWLRDHMHFPDRPFFRTSGISNSRIEVCLCSATSNPAIDSEALWVMSVLREARINTKYMCFVGEGGMPQSFIITPRSTGSRTVLHHRSIREYTWEDFCDCGLATACHVQWLHMEGRNIAATERLLHGVSSSLTRAPVISVEIERVRPEGDPLPALLPYANVILLSQDYCHKALRQHQPLQALQAVLDIARGTVPIEMQRHQVIALPWGEYGAFATLECSCTSHFKTPRITYYMPVSDAMSSIPGTAEGKGTLRDARELQCGVTTLELQASRIVPIDTVGAGDTFNAAFIWYLQQFSPPVNDTSSSHPLFCSSHATHPRCQLVQAALEFAVTVASSKVSVAGLDLSPRLEHILSRYERCLSRHAGL